MAALMGERLRAGSGAVSAAGGMVRGAIALELAVVVPVIGWFVVLPLGTVAMVGAATFAIVRWQPRAVVPPPLAWPMGQGYAVPMNDSPTPVMPVRVPDERAAWAERGGDHAPHAS